MEFISYAMIPSRLLKQPAAVIFKYFENFTSNNDNDRNQFIKEKQFNTIINMFLLPSTLNFN